MGTVSQGGGVFSVATVTLTNAQIKALPTTAVQLVAAPGAGLVLVPIFCWMHLTWAADYTNIGDGSSLGTQYGTTSGSCLAPLLESFGEVSNLLADSASHPAFLSSAVKISSGTESGIGQFVDDPGTINAAFNLYAINQGSHTGDFTGGAAGNALKVSVYYATFTN